MEPRETGHLHCASVEGGFPVKSAILSLVFALMGFAAHADTLRVLNGDAHFPEGPVWHHGKLYYVEYDRNSVTAWDGQKNTIFLSQKGCGPSAGIAPAHCEVLTTGFGQRHVRPNFGRG